MVTVITAPEGLPVAERFFAVSISLDWRADFCVSLLFSEEALEEGGDDVPRIVLLEEPG